MRFPAFVGKQFFSAVGWTYDVAPGVMDDPKQVVIGFPHTSNMDTILTIALFSILKKPFHVLVKQELFKPPFGYILKQAGLVPVARGKSSNIVEQMAREFAAVPTYTLILAPEGTRTTSGAMPPIHTGFWHIARAANVPLVLMLADSDRKKGALFARLELTEDMAHDLAEIKRLFAQQGVEVTLPVKS